jgi:hypothetical protein
MPETLASVRGAFLMLSGVGVVLGMGLIYQLGTIATPVLGGMAAAGVALAIWGLMLIRRARRPADVEGVV